MTIKVNLHNVSAMKAGKSTRQPGEYRAPTTWLDISDGKGNEVTIFMDYDTASEIVEMWEYSQREPEPPTYDETLAMKCDAEARMDEARVLKGML